MNSNYAAKRHRDKTNEGPSVAKAFGPFRGGRLAYWCEDDGALPIKDLPIIKRQFLNTHEQFGMFDGCRGHEVEDYTGERMSLVFYTTQRWLRADDADTQKLWELGFPVPTVPMMNKMHMHFPAAVGYTGAHRHSCTDLVSQQPLVSSNSQSSSNTAPAPANFAVQREPLKRLRLKAAPEPDRDWQGLLWPFQRSC